MGDHLREVVQIFSEQPRPGAAACGEARCANLPSVRQAGCQAGGVQPSAGAA